MAEDDSYRIERDSLGEVRVPKQALYGAQTQRAVENFHISGLKPWPVFITSVVLIKKSAAIVNADLGLLPTDYAEAIEQAADEILNGMWLDQFVVDPFQAGAGTSHNMNANEVLANRANQILGKECIHPNDHVNMAQSTNDVIPTTIRIGCLLRLNELTDALENLYTALRQKADEFNTVLKSGRTHLQDAVPVTLGQEFGAYADAILKDTDRIRRSADTLSELGIGGTAVGSGLNAHPDYHRKMIAILGELTGIKFRTSENLFERMQSMADMADFSSAMRTTALSLIRIANDFRLLSSGPGTGLDELHLPALQPGSSIMPGKVNPVMAEMLDMAMFHVIGCDTTVGLASQAGQLELNVMMPVIAHNLFEMMQIMIGSINAFSEKCVKGSQANSEKAAHWLDQNAIIVTVLNPLIGYAAGAALVKEAVEKKVPIRRLAHEKAGAGLLKRLDNGQPVSPAEIDHAFSDLLRMTQGGFVR